LCAVTGISGIAYEEDRDELNDKHALEQEVELPTTSSNTEWDRILI
jgi:hypothetical protein